MLRVNSPGGGVAACTAMRHDLERFKARPADPGRRVPARHGGRRGVLPGVGRGPGRRDAGDGHRRHRRHPEPVQPPRPDGPVQRDPAADQGRENVDIGTSARALTARGDGRSSRRWPTSSTASCKAGHPEVAGRRVDLDGGTTFDGRIFTGAQADGPRAGRSRRRPGRRDSARRAAWPTGGQCPAAGPAGGAVPPDERPGPLGLRGHGERPAPGGGAACRTCPASTGASCRRSCRVWQPELTMEKLGGK